MPDGQKPNASLPRLPDLPRPPYELRLAIGYEDPSQLATLVAAVSRALEDAGVKENFIEVLQ